MKLDRTRLLTIVSVVAALALVAWLLFRPQPERESLTLDEFEQAVADGEVSSAEIGDRSNQVRGELTDGTEYEVAYPAEYGDELTQLIADAEPTIELETDPEATPLWRSLLFSLLPLLILVGVLVWFLSSMQSGKGALKFGRIRAKKPSGEQPEVTFEDVAGLDEAVEELAEIRDFLSDPARFHALGAKIPRGVLLYGPPGTGKTLLARAVAGEAGAPFFSISGSDFVEMFVGVGASRVRNLFDQAKAESPAIVFIDEIDAVGRHRGAGLGGGHDEREQTLNQLLVEMDGFDDASGVIMIAATNRPDILDPALLRPGRFDRQIVVDRPDLEGRKAILEVHAAGKPLADDVDLTVVARRTPGFTGADLANLLNEAALLAARRGEADITLGTIGEAVDRVLGGPERKNRAMSDSEKRRIAYHEAGHAVVGHALPGTDPIHKVSIVARGRALGWTLALPTEDRYLQTRGELEDQLAMLMGGRTAEELVFGDPTTGAADDLEKATNIARSMVTEYGMSDEIGLRSLSSANGEVFLGKEVGHDRNYSESVAATVDDEVAGLVNAAHAEARAILERHRTVLDRVVEELVEHESLDEDQLGELFATVDPWKEAPAPELAGDER